MADVVGSAFYELEARDTRARQTIDQLEAHIKRAGGSAEPAFAAPVTAATSKAATGFTNAGNAAKAAGDALPTQRVGIFAGALDSARGKLGGITASVGNFAGSLKDRLGGALETVKGSLGAFGGQLGTLASSAFGAIASPLGLGVAGGVAASIIGIGVAALGASAEMETYRVQFETLLGSAGAAQERLDSLAKFAAATPFDLPGIVQASRTLEVFTKGAISTGDHLRIIGDAAASVSVPIEEVSFWTGRLYAAMAGGQPIGEMTLRLGEMGIIAPEVRTQIEQMAKGIKDGSLTINEAWPQVEQAFGRFAGGMERQSQTLSGRFSTFIDDVRMSLARFGDRIAPIAKDLLPGLGAALASVIDVLGEAIEVFGGFFVTVGQGIGHVETLLNDLKEGSLVTADWLRGLVGLGPVMRTANDDFALMEERVKAAGDSWDEAKGQLHGFAEQAGMDVNEFANRVAEEMERTGASFDRAVERVVNGWDRLPTVAEDSAVAASQRYTAAMEAGAADVEAGVDAGIRKPTEAELERTKIAAEAAGRAHTGAYAGEIAGGADIVTQAWEAMLQGAEDEMTATERIADIKAKLTSSKLREALASDDPFLKAQAIATRETLETELAYLENNTHEYARRTGQSLPDALRSQQNAAKRESALQAQQATRGLEDEEGNMRDAAGRLGRAALPPDPGMYDGGRRLSAQWVAGLQSHYGTILATAKDMAGQLAKATVPRSPVQEGPLRDMERAGGRLIRQWTHGMYGELGAVKQAAYDVAGAFTPDAALGGLISRASGEIRVRHEIIDPHGSLAAIPGGAPAVAAALNAPFDASGFVRNFSHLAGVN